jgi:hypothetical protein
MAAWGRSCHFVVHLLHLGSQRQAHIFEVSRNGARAHLREMQEPVVFIAVIHGIGSEQGQSQSRVESRCSRSVRKKAVGEGVQHF